MSARDQILAAIRDNRGTPADGAAVRRRLAEPVRGIIPARSAVPRAEQIALFTRQAESLAATVVRVDDMDGVPDAVLAYLARLGNEARIRRAPDPLLDGLSWPGDVEIESGRAHGTDTVSLTGAFAGIAETGTLMMVSGPEHPVSLNFLPDTHVVVLPLDRLVGAYEDAWDRLRTVLGPATMPRAVNFITGPSRTADIEQTIQLGAHGPRRLHILLVGRDEP